MKVDKMVDISEGNAVEGVYLHKWLTSPRVME